MSTISFLALKYVIFFVCHKKIIVVYIKDFKILLKQFYFIFVLML